MRFVPRSILKHQNDLAADMKNGNLLHVCACERVWISSMIYSIADCIQSRHDSKCHLVWLNSQWCSMCIYVSVSLLLFQSNNVSELEITNHTVECMQIVIIVLFISINYFVDYVELVLLEYAKLYVVSSLLSECRDFRWYCSVDSSLYVDLNVGSFEIYAHVFLDWY